MILANRRFLARPLCSVIAAIALVISQTAVIEAGDLVGRANVVDGDTLDIHSTRIRLWGIASAGLR